MTGRLARFDARAETRARWYINRLRCMTLAEVPFRLRRRLTAHAERLGSWRRDDGGSPSFDVDVPGWIHAAPNVVAARYLAAADRILEGRFDVFELHGVHLGEEPGWNRDPKTGTAAPLRFGKLLDYRDPALVGDIKYLWEPNRHMHLVTLAQAQALSGDPRYGAGIRRQLESWFRSCPYRQGPNWCSALEAAIRLINWAAAWQLLGGARSPLFDGGDGARLRGRWLRSVHQHVRFIRGHHSLYSSANNHLVGEAAGVYLATLTWPHWPEMKRWKTKAKTILERETLLQNAPDGVNREQAVAYQQFELDLLLLCLIAARSRGERFSERCESRIRKMIGYIASIMDAGGNVPMIGDSDNGYVVRLSQEEHFCPFRSVLATGALLFRCRKLRAKAGRLDDKTRWLFGAGADAAFAGGAGDPPAAPPERAFRHGGYYVLGCNFESSDEIRVIADAGSLGYGTLCAHGHADALAFTLSIGGREILVDPGTCTYRSDSHWRAYFRGTAAHNTLQIDGLDQSEPGGNFLWLRKANVRCIQWQTSVEQDVFEGCHDGYARLDDPVVHCRRITLDKATRRIVVEDRLQMSGPHAVELRFHCSERCTVEPLPYGFAIRRGEVLVRLRLPRRPATTADVHVGSHAPAGGWISRRFGERRPCPTIVWRSRASGDTVLRSELDC
jgi:hypothetical protein